MKCLLSPDGLAMFEALRLRQSEVKAAEENLRTAISKLDDEQRAAFFDLYHKKLKDPDTYAVLNWLFLTGMHHFYLGKLVRGTINFVVMIWGFTLLFNDPGWGILMILAVLLVEIPALFRSQIIVQHHNLTAGERLLKEFTIGHAGHRK